MSKENRFEAELETRAAAEAKIAALAMENAEFRGKLLTDPKTALAEVAGLEFPATVQVVVHEETEDTLHLVIPPAIPDELTDEQLEAVAGGAVFAGVKTATVAGVAASTGTSVGVGVAASKW